MSNPIQQGAIFKEGEKYIRMVKGNGLVYPYHEELLRLVRKGEAEIVECKGGRTFRIVQNEPQQEERRISKPARKPEKKEFSSAATNNLADLPEFTGEE